jgi:hypothetical protein
MFRGSESEKRSAADGPWLPMGLSFLSGMAEAQRRRLPIMAVQAFLDDSGNVGQHKWFVLAGWMATVEQWAAFSEDWQRCLDSNPRIAHFKLNEAVSCEKGEFRHWREDARDQKLVALARVIRRHQPMAVFYATAIEPLMAARASWPKPLSNPIFWAYQSSIHIVCHELFSSGQRERFEMFFDENSRLAPSLKLWYPVLRAVLEEEERLALMPVEPLFRDDKRFLPLQAADLLAGVLRQGLSGETSRLWSVVETELSGCPIAGHSVLNTEEQIDAFEARMKELSLSEPPPKSFSRFLAKFREVFGESSVVGDYPVDDEP